MEERKITQRCCTVIKSVSRQKKKRVLEKLVDKASIEHFPGDQIYVYYS